MKKCEHCGSENRVFKSKVNGQMLCHRHSLQLRRYGVIYKGDRYGLNKVVEKNDHFEIHINNYKTGELLGVVLIDKDDYGKVKNHKWDIKQGYARNRELGLMHRLFIEGDLIDHINMNKLDNRKSNLRSVDKRANALNSNIARGASGLRGVRKCNSKWQAYIKEDGKQKNLGVFDTAEEASAVYQAYKEELMSRCVRNV